MTQASAVIFVVLCFAFYSSAVVFSVKTKSLNWPLGNSCKGVSFVKVMLDKADVTPHDIEQFELCQFTYFENEGHVGFYNNNTDSLRGCVLPLNVSTFLEVQTGSKPGSNVEVTHVVYWPALADESTPLISGTINAFPSRDGYMLYGGESCLSVSAKIQDLFGENKS